MTASGEKLPWDIEFGFEQGRLRLFQIRPLVRYRELASLESLGALEAAKPALTAVSLDETP